MTIFAERLRELVIVIFLVLAIICRGQEIVIQPYLQDVSTDGVIVMWEVAEAGGGEVAWGTSPFALNLVVSSTSVNVQGASQIHTAVVSGLAAKSKYYYRVTIQRGQESTLRTFRTLAIQADNENIQLVAVSDMQRDGSQPNKYRDIIEQGIVPLIQEQISTDLHDLEAILIPGDLVSTGGSYNQWRTTFFNPSDSISGYVPYYPVPRNHEYFSGGLPNFKYYFSLPANGPAGLQDECWYKDISNVRVIGLNSNSGTTDQNTQLQWLSETLTSACTAEHIDFVFAQLHQPYK